MSGSSEWSPRGETSATSKNDPGRDGFCSRGRMLRARSGRPLGFLAGRDGRLARSADDRLLHHERSIRRQMSATAATLRWAHRLRGQAQLPAGSKARLKCPTRDERVAIGEEAGAAPGVKEQDRLAVRSRAARPAQPLTTPAHGCLNRAPDVRGRRSRKRCASEARTRILSGAPGGRWVLAAWGSRRSRGRAGARGEAALSGSASARAVAPL